jgi:hypothetical protein
VDVGEKLIALGRSVVAPDPSNDGQNGMGLIIQAPV